MSESVTTEDVMRRLGISSLAFLLGAADESISCFRGIHSANSINPDTYYALASIYSENEEFMKAACCFQRFLNTDQTNGNVWCLYGHCLLLSGDYDSAFLAYQNALNHSVDKADPDLWYGIGVLYEKMENYEQAVSANAFVLENHPNYCRLNEIAFRLGLIHKLQYEKTEKLLAAHECFLKAVRKITPSISKSDLYFQIGNTLEIGKNFDGAKEYYSLSIKENPRHVRALKHLGWLLFSSTLTQPQPQIQIGKRTQMQPLSQNAQKESYELIKYASTIEKNCNSNTFYMLGRVQSSLGDIAGAFDSYRQSLSLNRSNALTWCSIGSLYFSADQNRDALDAFAKCINISEGMSAAWYNLGSLYAEANQESDACRAFAQAQAQMNEIKKEKENEKKKENDRNTIGNQFAEAHQAKESDPTRVVIRKRIAAYQKTLRNENLTEEEKALPRTIEPSSELVLLPTSEDKEMLRKLTENSLKSLILFIRNPTNRNSFSLRSFDENTELLSLKRKIDEEYDQNEPKRRK